MTLTWKVNVDWNGDGVYEADEAAYLLMVESVIRGRQYQIRSDGKGFQDVGVGTATIVLDNSSGRFDAWNASGALYPNVTPGKYIQLQVNDGSGAVAVISGTIDNIQPVNNARIPQVRISIVDPVAWLKGQSFYGNVSQLAVDVSTIIGDTLTDWYPWGNTLPASGTTLINRWFSGKSFWEEFQDMANCALAFLYVAADGDLTLIPRSVFYNATTPDVTVDKSEILKDVTIGQPWDNIRNIVTVVLHPKAEVANVLVWTLHDIPYVRPKDDSPAYTAIPTYQGRQVAIIADFDFVWTANTASDGSGTDVSANFSATGDPVVFMDNETSGIGGYITSASITATVLDAPDTTKIQTVAAATYQPRELTLDLFWLDDTNAAQDYANWLAAFLSVPRKAPIIQIQNRSDLQFGYDIGAMIHLEIDTLGIDDNFRLGRIEHRALDDSGQSFRTTWFLEPMDTTAYWILNTSKLDTETRLGF